MNAGGNEPVGEGEDIGEEIINAVRFLRCGRVLIQSLGPLLFI